MPRISIPTVIMCLAAVPALAGDCTHPGCAEQFCRVDDNVPPRGDLDAARAMLARIVHDTTATRAAARGITLPTPEAIFEWPIAGRWGIDTSSCTYADRNTTTVFSNWMCNNWTYDGHRGTDISHRYRDNTISGPGFITAPPTAIFAADDGIVLEADDTCPDNEGECVGFPRPCCGNHVVLAHANGLVTFYCHLMEGSVLVSVGDYVTAGEQLGSMGNAGCSSGPHLHFEPQDPSIPDGSHYGAKIDPWVGKCNFGPSHTFIEQPTIRPRIRHNTAIVDDYTALNHKYYFQPSELTVRVHVEVTNFMAGDVMDMLWKQDGQVYATQSFSDSTQDRCIYGINYGAGRPTAPGTGEVEIRLNGQTAARIPYVALASPGLVPAEEPTPPPAIWFKNQPTDGRVFWCEISPSVLRMPGDVIYRYQWLLAGFIVAREWETDALSDAFPRYTVDCGQKISCRVTAFNQYGEADGVQVNAYVKSAVDGDTNCDGAVTFADITNILANYGGGDRTPYHPGDATGDGLINFADITYVLARWTRE